MTYTAKPGSSPEQRSGRYEAHTVTIQDGRPMIEDFSLEREGFVFVNHETKVKDFYDEDELRSVYYPEMEQLVKDLSGASRVLIFDHTLRAEDNETREEKKVREPVRRVHNDYTEWSGPQRVRDLLPPGEAEELLRHRFAVIQVWRPIRKPVQTAPLAIADALSIAPKDLIPTERRYPDRVGETYHITFNPSHRWYYFPEMRRNEAIVFKCYDLDWIDGHMASRLRPFYLALTAGMALAATCSDLVFFGSISTGVWRGPKLSKYLYVSVS